MKSADFKRQKFVRSGGCNEDYSEIFINSGGNKEKKDWNNIDHYRLLSKLYRNQLFYSWRASLVKLSTFCHSW